MTNNFLIYGAYGYTGELITQLAVQRGYSPILAGRNAEKTQKLAQKFNLPSLVFDLSETQKLDEALQKVGAVLHIAGPFSATAQIMVAACLRNRVHYLDVTGEIEVFEWVATQDQAAQTTGISLISGVGFDVVPSDCLAAYLKSQMPDATQLEMAIKAVGELSRGTMLTMVEGIPKGGKVRENGKIKTVAVGYRTCQAYFSQQPEEGISMPWGDVSTAYYTTQIPNIYIYFVLAPQMRMMMGFASYFAWFGGLSPIQSFLKWRVRNTVQGPSEKHRETTQSYLWGEVKNAQGKTFSARLETPEGYKLTAETALESVLRVLAGKVSPGFKTPALAFGADYILEFAGVKRENITQ
jgi:short subunit dehydrogenase-like uncharacterized protein